MNGFHERLENVQECDLLGTRVWVKSLGNLKAGWFSAKNCAFFVFRVIRYTPFAAWLHDAFPTVCIQ
jgi:hypothetical protein